MRAWGCNAHLDSQCFVTRVTRQTYELHCAKKSIYSLFGVSDGKCGSSLIRQLEPLHIMT